METTTTESSTPRTLGAVMSSEAGFEPEANNSELRVSGFIALLLAILSGFSIVAIPMVGFAIAAILFGVFALRKSRFTERPVGTSAARAAIMLAVLFGVWGTARFSFKNQTLGNQAEYFARQFVRVASSGNQIYASELQKSYVNRFLKTMPLEQYYEQQRLERERRAASSMEERERMEQEEADTTVQDLQKYSVDHPWELYRAVRVYTHYGRQMAEVILSDGQGKTPYRLLINMEYLVHKDRGTGEWYVENCVPYRERIVAESIL